MTRLALQATTVSGERPHGRNKLVIVRNRSGSVSLERAGREGSVSPVEGRVGARCRLT